MSNAMKTVKKQRRDKQLAGIVEGTDDNCGPTAGTLGSLRELLGQDEKAYLKAHPGILQNRECHKQQKFNENTVYTLPGWVVKAGVGLHARPQIVYVQSTENLLLNFCRQQRDSLVPNHIYVDASYRVMSEGYATFPVGVLDRNQQFHTCCQFISSAEDTVSHELAIAMIVDEVEAIQQERYDTKSLI